MSDAAASGSAAAGRTAVAADWWLVLAMTAASAMALFDVTAFGVALPSLREGLGLSAGTASWVVNAYIVAVTALTALGGRLADRLNGLTVFQCGAALFAIASLACGLAPTAPEIAGPWLIAFRALQGAGGALMLPAALAAVVAAVPADRRGRAVSLYIGAGQVLFILGPIAGGLLTQELSWRAIFLVAVPLSAAAIAMTRLRGRRIAGAAARPAEGPLLRWTALPLIAGLALIALALERGGDWGWLSWQSLAAFGFGTTALAVAVRQEWRAPDPMVQLHLLRQRHFSLHLATLCLLQTVTIGVLTFAPIYFQKMLGLSPSDAGLVMLAFVAGWAGMVPMAGWLHDRLGPARPKLAGAVLALAGMAWWWWSLPHLGPAAQLPAMALAGVGVGLSILPSNTAAIGAAPPQGRAAAVGLIQTVRQSGGMIAVALLGGLFLDTAGGAGSSAAALDAAQLGFAVLLTATAVNLPVALLGLRGAPPERGPAAPQR
ncbi:MFS transporter [Marinibaculum pumilum]|uniref:MFS transporter n=1 Tax=Marinibaculum pumilum TaxID=1766165 RepID=A0ABV7L585_9PROT